MTVLEANSAASFMQISTSDANLGHIDHFKQFLYSMQEARRSIVKCILEKVDVPKDLILVLESTLRMLTDSRTVGFQRKMRTQFDTFTLNIKDEIIGLKKDLEILSRYKNGSLEASELETVLANFHPISPEKFVEELDACCSFLVDYVESAQPERENRKPLFITDWDGTMKDYCSQYATNLQPIYSAVCMAGFAQEFTRLAAVLTAGPLRGPGILDLTALPIDGPLLFSGSWGREWWLDNHRVVQDEGISEEGIDALERMKDEMGILLKTGEYSQFALVGSGVQRKVDRLTLGVQTVCGHVPAALSERYQEEVRERMHRVDPYNQILVFDPSTELEVEVVAHSSGSVWNKANGVSRVAEIKGDSLRAPGRVLVCGDTMSDVPMVQQAKHENPGGVMALFVRPSEKIRESVLAVVGDPTRVCFISSPDVFHAAAARLLETKSELD
ncbi:unnamed protein product, partial [Mesorhabditis belari]|uniref:Uncharacterized protein n=1 Tax=Mesorhabditis belari TaxID=2138241 RepID=A0AAF3ES44_9BILA